MKHKNGLVKVSFNYESQSDGIPLKIMLESIERKAILDALDAFNWCKADAARFLMLQRTTLVEKLRRYKITKPEKQ